MKGLNTVAHAEHLKFLSDPDAPFFIGVGIIGLLVVVGVIFIVRELKDA